MPINKATRTKMERHVYETFNRLDPSGVNTAKYRALFKEMSDSQFDSFFRQLFADDNQYLILDTVDYERDLTIDHIEDAAKYLGINLFEYVALPFINGDKENPIVTKVAVPDGYIHIKRMQQTLSKKNTTSTSISQRSALTGQVTGKDKNARGSDMENFALVTIDANQTLRELLGPRADDMVMKSEMYSQIAQKGYVSLDTLPNDVDNKATLNALDIHFIGMGIKTDLVTDNMLLKKTLKS